MFFYKKFVQKLGKCSCFQFWFTIYKNVRAFMKNDPVFIFCSKIQKMFLIFKIRSEVQKMFLFRFFINSEIFRKFKKLFGTKKKAATVPAVQYKNVRI